MKLIIPKEVEERIHAYAMSVPSEIAGMGKVRVSPNGEDIIVEEVMIYDQEVTGATADLSQESIAKWLTALVQAGESPKNWKLWFHSHDNMPAFFSGRDVATIDGQTEGDWLVSLVVNKHREREARLDTYRPFRMYMDKLDIQIGTEAEPAYQVPADIVEEVARKVKRPAPRPEFGYSYTPATTIADTIALHRFCPMYTIDEKRCYRPYGTENKAVYAVCTTKEFKKKYGANPFLQAPESTERSSDYTRDQLVAICKTLEGQIWEYENRGQGDCAPCLELSSELVDMYYELAEVETEPSLRAELRKEAETLEESIYQMETIH